MPDFCWCVFANGCQRVSAGIYGRDAKKYEQIKQKMKSGIAVTVMLDKNFVNYVEVGD
jgi:hypothetical protein